MSDTEHIITVLREFGNVECNTACELHMRNAADKIKAQQKTINEMADALDFIYLGVAYIFSHQPDGEELVGCLKNISNKARTTLDANGVDLVEVARRSIEERKS